MPLAVYALADPLAVPAPVPENHLHLTHRPDHDRAQTRVLDSGDQAAEGARFRSPRVNEDDANILAAARHYNVIRPILAG